ncbi:hypothetical protein LOC68_02295 [Blastopirellula sp. JC732]|uniref:J domain-containing protein n=1 Tax=Blastopirellula sediminis TaxID=2894196 RepID=A0A9X1MHJ2_9BACT|nr:hypothetical protein [Blastopirellula sediminis]MCC9607979.1 hypothetical protein [Blastopirellula sediminis]MCC9627228.1 hypothetical protein [Blastopirellula sediminis]
MEIYDPQIAAWFGITPMELPADYYRWLGVRAFETSAAAITQGYDIRRQQLAQVGATGDALARANAILHGAYYALSDPVGRAAYDQWLVSQANLPQ